MSNPSLESPKTVLVFGDSITEAKDLPENERDRAWVCLVEKNSGGRVKTINEGKGGRPTSALREFEEMLQRHPRPDLFVIALGGNDARDTTCSCVPNAFSNLRIMIERSREAYGSDLPILLVAPTNIRKDCLGPSRPIADEREENLVALGAAIKVLADESGCHFVSTYNSIPPASLAIDGVHPDKAGHAAIAAIMLPAVLSASGADAVPQVKSRRDSR